MASNRGLAKPGSWNKHLRPIGKRIQAKAERQAAEKLIEEEVPVDDSEDESEEEIENLCGPCMCLGRCKGSGTGSCPPED